MLNGKPILEYDFLKLLIATIKIGNYDTVLNRIKLQKDLFEYYKSDEYKLLFSDVIEVEDTIDLSGPFLGAYAYGTISMIHDGDKNTKYMINMDNKTALKIMDKYTPEERETMAKLVSELYKEDSKVFKKTNNN